MILYFSATGNSRFIAEQLAGRLGDEALNLLERIRNQDYSELRSERPFVLCSPVYVCEMPRFLAAYLKKTSLTGSREVYCVFTNGGYAGVSGVLAKRLFRKKGMSYRGQAEFTMPRNYIASNSYPELGRGEIERRILTAARRLPAVAEAIRKGEPLRSRHVWFFETLITLPFNPVWCRVRQSVKHFYPTGDCIGCGTCARLCPLHVIRMEEGRPVWTGKSCAHCMSCIQNCPVEAIEYGEVTREKKRYRFEKYRGILPSDGKRKP